MTRDDMEATVQEKFDNGRGREIFKILLESAPTSILEIILRFVP